MATSLAVMIILGLLAHYLFTKLRLPGLLGMIIVGIAIGPHGLNLVQANNVWLSDDFRKIALIIILLRAGLGVKKEELKKVGRAAVSLGFIPCLFEGLIIAIVSTQLLNFTWIQGGLLGMIIAAVSPAVIVPQMLSFMEKKVGTLKGIPTMILAGASIDNVFAITLFSTFMGLYSGKHINLGMKMIGIPISIIFGITLGCLLGFVLVFFFKKYHIRDTKKVLLILAASIFLTAIEKTFKTKIEIAGLLGVMTIGFILLEKLPLVGQRLSIKFNKLWIFAEIILFILVGTQVKIEAIIDAGWVGIILIVLGLIGRSIGVLLSVIGTNLTIRERLFCIIAYTPKATVQAAMGAIPLSMCVPSGEVILAIAVLSVIVTAPLGATFIHYAAPKLLNQPANA